MAPAPAACSGKRKKGKYTGELPKQMEAALLFLYHKITGWHEQRFATTGHAVHAFAKI